MASVITRFDLAETLRCRNGLRRAMTDGSSMEGAAREGCRFLYDELVTRSGSRACALVRCYKLHDFGDLPDDLQDFSRQLMPRGIEPTATMRCLALLATCGDAPEWNDRRRSKGHRAIPLPSTSTVERAPMVAQLFRAFGIDIASIVAPTEDIVHDLAGKSYGVFHVAHAKGSPYIPAQDFVVEHGIRSVLGFGGSLKTGDLFAIILFAKVTIPEESADRFRTVALDAKGALFTYDRIFE